MTVVTVANDSHIALLCYWCAFAACGSFVILASPAVFADPDARQAANVHTILCADDDFVVALFSFFEWEVVETSAFFLEDVLGSMESHFDLRKIRTAHPLHALICLIL